MIEKPELKIERENQEYGKYKIEPLERGFGTTLGNALRRILLSSLPGAAVKGILIEGVSHQFQTIEGVTEDVTEIILNLKGLYVKITDGSKEIKKLTLEVKKAGPVLAKDFKLPGGVEIKNPDMYICTKEETKEPFKLTAYVGMGRGYALAETNKNIADDLPINFIPIDSIYTPVEKATYDVEPLRVGKSIDFDKLIIDVTTNGTVQPREVMSLAAKIMQEHLKLFEELTDEKIAPIWKETDVSEDDSIRSMSIKDLGLSQRAYNCIEKAKINTVGELMQKTVKDLTQIKNLGEKSVTDIVQALAEHGVALKGANPMDYVASSEDKIEDKE